VIKRHGVVDPKGPFVIEGIPYVVFCFYCKLWLTKETFTLDHLDPVSNGGNNSVYNFVPSCGPCNWKRGATPLAEEVLQAALRYVPTENPLES
jgi:5-methylcytosine-specific restriction endonuclease McrA